MENTPLRCGETKSDIDDLIINTLLLDMDTDWIDF